MARKIKSLKQKLANETYSDAIPLGADASNVDLTDGSNVQDTLDHLNSMLEWKEVEE